MMGWLRNVEEARLTPGRSVPGIMARKSCVIANESEPTLSWTKSREARQTLLEIVEAEAAFGGSGKTL